VGLIFADGGRSVAMQKDADDLSERREANRKGSIGKGKETLDTCVLAEEDLMRKKPTITEETRMSCDSIEGGGGGFALS